MPLTMDLPLAQLLEPIPPARQDTINEGLGELIEDIAQNGLINPIAVRDRENGFYEILAGHRRYLAHREMGKATIRCSVYLLNEGDDDLIRGAENFHRTQMNPLEEARWFAYQMQKHGISAAEVARRYKRSATEISRALALLEGDERVADALARGLINKAQAYEINKVRDEIGRGTALEYACGGGFTAQGIKAWREGRESNGVSTAMSRVQVVISEAGPPSMLQTFYCMFCKTYHELQNIRNWSVCTNCESELTKAVEVYNEYERLQLEAEKKAAEG